MGWQQRCRRGWPAVMKRAGGAVLLVSALLAALLARCGAVEVGTGFIVEFEPEALAQEATVSAAAAAVPGVSPATRAARPQLAQQAAGIQAASSLASNIVGSVKDVQLAGYQSYGLVFSGMAVEAASPEDAGLLQQQLLANPRVKRVYPDFMVPAPKPVVPKPAAAAAALAPAATRSSGVATAAAAVAAASSSSSNSSSVDNMVRLPLGSGGSQVAFTPNVEWATADLLTGVAELRSNFALTGRGVKIGVIDTGIDYTHPAFGSCTGINAPAGRCRVVAGRDFVGDAYTGGSSKPQPDNDPRDCYSGYHGTTVAGVAAAGWYEGAPMLGVAPEALIGAYKVYGCKGSAPMSAIISAIQQAVLDGMDIINLSLSLGPGFPAEPYVSVMRRAFSLGMLAVKSAGNSGEAFGQGLFWADGFTGAGSIMVGAVDTSSGIVGQLPAAAFSTYGPGANLNLLPCVSAPGSNVLTTSAANEPGSGGAPAGYAVMSGTSHATPYVAGGLALMLQLQQLNTSLAAPASTSSTSAAAARGADADDAVAVAAAGLGRHRRPPRRRRPYPHRSPAPAPYPHRSPPPRPSPSPSPSPPPGPPGLQQLQAAWNSGFWRAPTQDSALASLVSTATYVSADDFEAAVPSAVAKSGAGLVSLAAAYHNAAELTPNYISLPSALASSHSVMLTLRDSRRPLTVSGAGSSPAAVQQPYTYAVRHRARAAALPILPEWGQSPLIPAAGLGASVTLSPRSITLAPGGSASITVTFTLPAQLRSNPWLYSGNIDLLPTSRLPNGSSVVWRPNDRWGPWWAFNAASSPLPGPRPLTVPYQGVSQDYSRSLPIIPIGPSFAAGLLQPALCYAPNSRNSRYPQYVMDIGYDVNDCEVLTAEGGSIDITLARLQSRPCDLRIALAPQLPVRRILLQLLSASGGVLGSLPPLETPVFSRAPAYDASAPEPGTDTPPKISVYSYCLSWRGQYTPAKGNDSAAGNGTVSVQVGSSYRLAALLERSVALGDTPALPTPPLDRIVIPGSFKVTA